MTQEKLDEQLGQICHPGRSGRLLFLGLLICLPLFYWWGLGLRVHRVRMLEIDERGELVSLKERGRALNLKQVEAIRNKEGEWEAFDPKRLERLPAGEIELKWEAENIWSLIRSELFP
jgi:hypothetical protein